MKFKNIVLTGAALLCAAPMFASSYYVGFEDATKGDYDYNDVVFSLSGSGLTLNTSGKFYSQPTLNDSGNPFWNNASFDKPSNAMNVGFCIYGGGACNGGVALDAGAQYLASAATPTQGATDVTFSENGNVNATIQVSITAANDTVGWYSLTNPGTYHAFGSTPGSTYTFNPGGDFGLYGVDNSANPTEVFASQAAFNNSDVGVSHFAIFSSAAPEPGALGMIGIGLTAVGALLRRKKTAKS